MQIFSDGEFDELLKDPDNKICFDCGKTPTQWASVNNGIYLCINCSGNHRGYGVHISYIKSLTLDKWNGNQIGMMRCGGNKMLQELLNVYQIDKKKVNIEKLYCSKLFNFYRCVLKCKETNAIMDKEFPSKNEALKLNTGFDLGTNVNKHNECEETVFKEMLNDWKIKYLNVNYNNNNHINKKEQNIINNNNNVIINNITENISNKNKTQTTVSKLNIFYIYIFKYSLTILEIHFLKKQMIL
jgi:hypothetical protein